MDLYRLTIQDSQDSMQFDLLDAPIKIEDVEGAVDNTVLTGDIFTDYLFLKKRWEQKWAIMCKDEYERLRGFYTRQWSLATVPSVKVTQGYLENASWEGQVFYINTPYGGEIDSMSRMTGDTFQQSYTGKNLLDIDSATGKTDRGVIATISGDGTIAISGTATSTGNAVLTERYDFAQVWSAGTYTFSIQQPLTRQLYIHFTLADNSTQNIILTAGETSASRTFTQSLKAYDLRFAVTSGVSYDETATPMVESGSTATTYEPYVGGTPSPNPDYPQAIRTVTGTQTISINGTDYPIGLARKNLLSIKPTTNSGVTSQVIQETGELEYSGNTTGGWVWLSDSGSSMDIDNIPAGTYTFSIQEPMPYSIAIRTYRPDGTYPTGIGQGITAGNTSATFTIDFPVKRIIILASLTAGDVPTTRIKPQLEAGSIATSFDPYMPPIELNDLGEGYQDYIWRDGVDWKVHKAANKKVYDGINQVFSARSGTGATGKYRFQLGGSEAEKSVERTNQYSVYDGLCDLAPAGTRSQTYLAQLNTIAPIFGTSYGYIGLVYLVATSGMTTAQANTWLTTHNMTVKYALATPTETTISDPTLIAQLNAIQAALQEGQNTVAVTANGSNLPAKTITLNGIAGREKPVLAQTNVRIGLSDGGVLNACECRQNVALSMRETA